MRSSPRPTDLVMLSSTIVRGAPCSKAQDRDRLDKAGDRGRGLRRQVGWEGLLEPHGCFVIV